MTILPGVATWEREIMLERQCERIAKAQDVGKYKGRPVSIDAAQIRRLRVELRPAMANRPEFSLPRARICWREPLRRRYRRDGGSAEKDTMDRFRQSAGGCYSFTSGQRTPQVELQWRTLSGPAALMKIVSACQSAAAGA